ncbi:hypothetical protein [Conyzicola sp.]|uniref:hypothetical protein n=1 Tax=Conyzicola sp. TaxID=1969404 RepID=UPI003989EC84
MSYFITPQTATSSSEGIKMRSTTGSVVRKRILGGVAVVGVAASVAFFGTLSAHADDAALKILDNSASSPGATELLSMIDEVNVGQSGLDTSKLVKLGENASGAYWTARDNSGNVCIIVTFAEAGISGSSCAPAENFATEGTHLALSGGDKRPDLYVEAYLVPDVVELSTARISGLMPMGENLLVGDTRAAEEVTVDVPSTGTDDFTLRLAQME